jgi:H+/gluconate symporter-like permease
VILDVGDVDDEYAVMLVGALGIFGQVVSETDADLTLSPMLLTADTLKE